MYKSSSKNFQPGLKMTNEQKADEKHVSPIANANVSSNPKFSYDALTSYLL